MDEITLTISRPRTMKDFIDAKVSEGRFSISSEDRRSLMHDDQHRARKSGLARSRRGILSNSTPQEQPRSKTNA
jgi:Arc/MetJ-type ribon-helix-helix transcriptional regulator